MADELDGFEIPVTLGGIGNIRKEIKQLKGELADALDPADAAVIAEKIGVLQDNLMRVNEQAQIFASGSKFEQAGNALGLVGSQLASLDFEGAAESALLLQDRINSITPEEITKQMKGLTDTFTVLGKVGGTAIIGIIKNVGAMAKAFLAFGAQLLMNPIFLFALVIAAIVAAIVLLLSKLGLLKPLMDAIGKVFEWIGMVIDVVVQAIKDFLDWLGLTSFAAEDAAEKQAKYYKDVAEASEKYTTKAISNFNHEINMAKIQGESTEKLMRKKLYAISANEMAQATALYAELERAKIMEDLNEEEMKELRDKLEVQKQTYRESVFAIREFNAQVKAESKKKKEEDRKEAEATAKEEAKKAEENAKKANEAAKKWRQDRFAFERQFEDVRLSMMVEGIDKELKLNKSKYDRLIEDTKRNENLLAKEKKALIESYTQQAVDAEQKIRQADAERMMQRQLADAKMIAQMKLSQDEKNLELKKEVLEAEREVELSNVNLTTLEKQAIEEKYRKARLAILDEEKALKEQEFADELAKVEKKAELALLQNENDLQAARDLLDAQMAIELNNKELTEEEKALIEEKYRQAREELDAKAAERRKAIEAGVADAAVKGLEGIMAINDLVYAMKSKRLQKGSEEEQRAAKKNFETNKKLQIAMAVVQGIQAVLAAYSSGSAVPVVGVVLGPVFAALAAVATIANINKIKSTTFDGGGGGSASTGGGGASAAAAAASSAPSFNLSGKPNEGNNTQASKPVEQNMNITVETNISEAEVTKKQQNVIKYENNATLKNG